MAFKWVFFTNKHMVHKYSSFKQSYLEVELPKCVYMKKPNVFGFQDNDISKTINLPFLCVDDYSLVKNSIKLFSK